MRGINVLVCQGCSTLPGTLERCTAPTSHFTTFRLSTLLAADQSHTHTPHPAVSAQLARLPDVSLHFPKEDQLVRMMQFGAFDKYFYGT